MTNLLFDLLVDKTKSEAEEIKRLTKFRGLNFDVEEKDIHLFLNKYFSKDSISNQERGPEDKYERWPKSFAGKPLWGIRINPLELEPFIARYVNAVNQIGAKTLSSCDGWHDICPNERKAHILFKDRYSRIWHKIMCSRLENNHNVKWIYEGNKASLMLPKTDKGKIETYIALNKNAEEFERNHNQILDIKEKIVLIAKGKKKSILSDKEVEEWLVNLINDIESNS